MGTATEHRIVIIGGREARKLVSPLLSQGLRVRHYESVRHAFRQGRRLGAVLAIIGPYEPGFRPATICWRARMMGFCGRTVVLLASNDETTATDLHRAGADDTLNLPATQAQLLRHLELSLHHRRSSWMRRARVGDLVFDFQERTARLQGRLLRTRPLAFEALSYVALHGTQVIPWTELARQLLGDAASISSARHVMRWACSALGEHSAMIQRIHGQGCRRNPALSLTYEVQSVKP